MEAMGLSNKNKWFYSVNCVGRDMVFTLVSLFMLTYIQYTMNLTSAQFIAITGIIVACRVWDAINDPMMGTIITNTRSKFGKYRPWVLIGAILNAIVLVLMFTVRPDGWGFVAFFGVMYLLWGMTYTINDVSYWSLLPALAVEKKQRDELTTLVVVFAAIGAFSVGGLVPMLTPGDEIRMYRLIAIIVAIIFLVCQVSVFLFVKDNTNEDMKKPDKEEKITLKKMFKVITNNPQLMWMAVVVLLYSLGSALLNAFGQNFFYFEFEYEGTRMFIFTIIYAVGTLGSQTLYPLLVKNHTRKDLLKKSFIILFIGYVLFFILGGINFDANIKLIILCVLGLFIFSAQGIFYLNMLIMLTNTIEYDEWKTGKRNESIIFSIRPFMVKLAGAIQYGVVALTLVITGLYGISNDIANIDPDLSQSERLEIGNQIIQDAATSDTFWLQKLGLRFAMTIIPIILFTFAYYIMKNKYIIDEEMYDKILQEINARKLQEEK